LTRGSRTDFPLSALADRPEVMRLGGHVDDVDRMFLMSQTAAAEPWALAAMLAVIDTYQQEGTAEQLHRIGAGLRRMSRRL
jgi:adenosylmethionine-8-amino-7-oxononanoate aminotransferase